MTELERRAKDIFENRDKLTLGDWYVLMDQWLADLAVSKPREIRVRRAYGPSWVMHGNGCKIVPTFFGEPRKFETEYDAMRDARRVADSLGLTLVVEDGR